MIRIFFRHVWDSLKNLKRNGWMTVAAVSSVTITLILVGVFLSFILNTTKLANDLQNQARVVVYLNSNTNDEKATIPDPKNPKKQITNPNFGKIKKEIEGVKNVKSIKASDKNKQLKQLVKTMGSTWNIFTSKDNPLLDVYVVKANKPTDVKQVARDVEKLDGINRTNYGGSSTDKIFALARTTRLGGFIAAVLLILVAVFLISNTIRITIMSRSREIQIMRLVGAKNGYIRWPFFLEGAWVGLVGAIVPVILVTVLYRIAYTAFQPMLTVEELSLYHPNGFILWMSVLLVALGVIIGALGSMLSMRRYLKA